jgi:hypothetical protein
VRRALVVLGVLIVAGLGWGCWQARTHGTLHVALHDVALKNDRQLWGDLRAAEVAFKDEAGAVLATGSAGPPFGVFSIRHPTVGDCRREETAATVDRAAMDAWNRCFAAQSRWFPTWVRRARYAEVKAGECRVERTPVELRESKSGWWLWWVPSPHLGGSPYTYFTLSVWIDSRGCRAATPER